MPAPPSFSSSVSPFSVGSPCILGIDPGLRRTGWAVLVMGEGGGRVAGSGVIAPPVDGSMAHRLQVISDGITAVIDAHHPDAVVLERPFVQRNVRSAMALAQAQAAAMLAAASHDLPVVEYAPREVKQVVTGDGHAEKLAVARALQLQLGQAAEVTGLDASDALAVAYCHALIGASPRRSTPEGGTL